MIHVDRKQVKPPTILTGGAAKGAAETRKAVKLLAPRKRKPAKRRALRKFEFSVYRDEDVKRALNALFHGKCAYCESRYVAVQPMDVEHWRPKSIYYWLAADWDNLLPSCIDCNRRREQLDAIAGKKGSSGKGTEFPVKVEAARWIDHRLKGEELPLLLNPCVDKPEEHLEFFDEAFVRSRGASEKGSQSISVYGLNRTGLVLERREYFLRLKAAVYTIDCLAQILDETGARHQAVIEDLIGREVEFLERALRPEQPYAQMARQLLEPDRAIWRAARKKSHGRASAR